MTTSLMSVRPVAALRLAQDLVEQLGVNNGDQRVSIPYSTREMARALDRSSGTVTAQLRQLDELGIRVAAKPITVIDVSRLNHALGVSTAPASAEPSTNQLMARLIDIVEKHPETAGALSLFAQAIVSDTRETTPVEQPVTRETTASTRDVSHARADLPRKLRKKDPLPSTTAAHSRTVAEAVTLIEPLETEAQRLGLPSTNRAAGLVDALSSYRDDEIRAGVERLRRELVTDRSQIRNPVSVLITRARTSPEFFAPLPSPNATAPATVSVEHHVDMCRSLLASGNRSDVDRYLADRKCTDDVIAVVMSELDAMVAA